MLRFMFRNLEEPLSYRIWETSRGKVGGSEIGQRLSTKMSMMFSRHHLDDMIEECTRTRSPSARG